MTDCIPGVIIHGAIHADIARRHCPEDANPLPASNSRRFSPAGEHPPARRGNSRPRRYPMATNPGILGLDLLNAAPYGAYSVDLSQTIRLWNPSAQRITGHRAEDVIGRHCHEVLQNLFEDHGAPACQDGCPSLQAAREGRPPPVCQVRMLCASGHRKLVTITPMIIVAAEAPGPMLIHLFHEIGDRARAARVAETVEDLQAGPTPDTSEGVTNRELEVLKLTAGGLTPREIAGELHISYHTVRNYIASARRKLGAPTKLDMIRNAKALGLI